MTPHRLAFDHYVSYGERIRHLATSRPDDVALTFVTHPDGAAVELTWRELDARSDSFASGLAARGVGPDSLVVVKLRNSVEHVLTTVAVWKLGACVVPLRSDMPAREREQILRLAKPDVVVSLDPVPGYECLTPAEIETRQDPDWQLADARPGKAVCSGGSTGVPKLIFDPLPWGNPGAVAGTADGHALEPLARTIGFRHDQTQLVAGPLYHNAPFGWGYWGLFFGHHLVVLERFTPEMVVDCVERYGVNFMFAVPTMMMRIMRLDGVADRDWSSIESLFHGAASCPRWLKKQWMDLLGPSRVRELYGATEAIGASAITGDEWLAHEGSVGKPLGCDLRILDDDQRELPAGEVGMIYMRPHYPGPTYEYRGSEPAPSTSDGFITVGDFGRVDDEGYLYIADRRVDLIISGGANIFPAEVEEALLEHPEVADAAVIGLPHPEWGQTVHAVVQPADGSSLTAEALSEFMRGQLAAYKLPKTYELIARVPRDEAGKLRRSALLAERTGSA
ncbi:AMP-binding protein [Amycolatopsis viridis]|uniref:Bile acid-coenzyme A ligase n=1 Tax=Amycolatopsis viridis TaxID=185678 RepID=A0ABX0SRD3_9PSEU|nr:AMP-binding protein [Amycolatopsis viridis]NIH78487.1 bile acid-coenzyme A ligase [Amycolatopsis viridis]